MYYSVCASAVFSGLSLIEALEPIRRSGAKAYEFWGLGGADPAALARAQEENGLRLTAMCTNFFVLNDPARRGEYLQGLREALAAAKILSCPTLITQVGQEIAGVSRAAQHNSIVEGLRSCAPLLEDAGVTLVIEPLNILVDHRGYYLSSSEEAFQIVREVGSPRVKVLYDVYHQQITEGNLISTLTQNVRDIGHIHIAGVPGRHEVLDACEINYAAVLKALKEAGYEGAVGLEYNPQKAPVEGLRELMREIPLEG